MFKFHNVRMYLLILLLAEINSPLPGHAATQGTLGPTSTGSVNISVTKVVEAQITDISDMTLPSWSIGDGDVTLYSNICVYSSTGSYKVTATGSGAGNAFTLSSGGNDIPYSVTWNSNGTGALDNNGTPLGSNMQSTDFSNAATTTADCNHGGAGNDTARVIINITDADMTAAMASSTPYSGTITMLITPF